jgi:hypothetical protein
MLPAAKDSTDSRPHPAFRCMSCDTQWSDDEQWERLHQAADAGHASDAGDASEG